jgi:hypothetical protein
MATRITLINQNASGPVEDLPLDHMEVWYDDICRVWTIQQKDAMGDQIDTAEHCHGKADAIDIARQYGVPVHLFKNGNELVKVIKP